MPARREAPRTVEELREIVRTAARQGQTVKAVGSGHAANAAACTSGVQISLDRLDGLLSIDHAAGTVRVQGGMLLARLNQELDRAGLAIASLGDINRQAVAGAIATGTHGTAPAHGTLSSQVTALTLMVADGSVVTCSPDENPELFLAARTGLGALGVVVDITFSCVPTFRLHQRMELATLDDIERKLDELLTGHPYFDLLYDFRSDTAFARTRDFAGETRPSRSRARVFIDDWASQIAYGAICRTSRNDPARFDRWVARLPTSARSDFVDVSHRVFIIPQLIRLVSSEWAVPLDSAFPALRAIGEAARERGINPGYAIQVRFTAADESFLSPAYGRPTAWIGTIAIDPLPWREYLELADQIASQFEARPHWGKWHAHDREALSRLYPRWDDFRRIRSEVDPTGMFANVYLDTVLDPL